MTDNVPDDARLRSAEAQMRRALGLRGDAPPAESNHQPATLTSGSLSQRRRFVRDGEVPVTVVRREHHHDGEPGTNQLEAARQAIRSQAAATERAERSLEEAQAVIHDLQTKLGHERIAKVEAIDAVRRLEADRQTIQQALQTVQAELAAERVARQGAEGRVRKAVADREEAERRLREAEVVSSPIERKATVKPPRVAEIVMPEPVDGGAKRGRGRPPKVVDDDSDIVEWWKPGWREKFR
jgi:hypothetical protein